MEKIQPREILRVLLLAAGIGIPVSLVALAFLAASHGATTLLWTDLPDQLGFSASAWWWVLLVPTVGGVLAGLAVRLLPGNGGHEPIDGFKSEPVLPSAIPGIILAALASLPFGAVLGPEAPLVALGGALGVAAAQVFRVSGTLAPLAASAGMFASISALFHNPLPAAFLILEVAGIAGGVPLVAVVLPGMLAAGLGYVVFEGVGSWTGVTTGGMEPLELPAYSSVGPGDLGWSVVVGVGLALVVFVVRVLGRRAHGLTLARPGLAAPAAGLAVGLCALVFAQVTGETPSIVLFSGETGSATVVEQAGSWGAATLVLLLVMKALAYAVSLGSLFRGGPVFPSLFLGVAMGMLLAQVVPGLGTTPAVVACMAAAAAAMLRLPLSAVLLSVLLCGTAGLEAASLALVAAAVSFLASAALDRGRTRTA